MGRVRSGACCPSTTGRVLSRQGMSGIYELLDFMTTDSLYSHHSGRARQECLPYLAAQQRGTRIWCESPGFVPRISGLRWLTWKELLHGSMLQVDAVPQGVPDTYRHSRRLQT